MFLNIIKYNTLKKSVKKQLSHGQEVDLKGDIKEVGVILNQKHFSNKDGLIWELGQQGIQPESVFFLMSNSDVKNLKSNEAAVEEADFDSNGQMKNEKIKQFIQRPFDVLISYYDVDELLLLWCTAHSKAKFKVGFSNVKSVNNHFSIQVEKEKYKTYIDELFRYIKILKK